MPAFINSLCRFFIAPLLSLISTIYSFLLFILPQALQTRLQRSISINRQLLNLLIGRLLPDLTQQLPPTDLTGRNAIVTGANSGIGLQIALELTRRGASVVMACRSPQRGETARQHILWNFPDAKASVSVLELDL